MWHFEVRYRLLLFHLANCMCVEMDEPGGNCNELIEKTADALSGEQLQAFFLSTQRITVDLCLKYGIRA